MQNLMHQCISALSEKLKQIISGEQIRPMFQPIVSLRDGCVLGYEALSRGPQGTEFESPETMFTVAGQSGCLWELERLCRTKALRGLKESGANIRLFLNVNPMVLEDPKFQKGFTKEYLDQYGIDPENIIFEITEKNAIFNNGEFRKIIQYYKAQNYKIAIDDAGAGYAGLNMISDVQPHYLKLDMNLIRGVDKDTVKQALIKSMQEYSRITGSYLIGEGIETRAELQTLIHIGVQFGQGFFIGRPGPNIAPIDPEVVDAIYDINAKRNHIQGYHICDVYIGNLCVEAMVTAENMMISEAYETMSRAERLPGFCVARDGVVRGVVTRNVLNAAVAGVYGYSLYSRRSIIEIMDTDFLSMDYKTPVNVAGKLAMMRPDSKVYDFITVTAQGRYYGIVTIRDLLERMIEIEVTTAVQLNPLTMLPGNVLIERALDEALQSHQKRCVLYYDIDNFKAYNDVYGFEKGDRMIAHLARLLRTSAGEKDFIGHLGGDDFVAIVAQEGAEDRCKAIIAEFDRSIAAFFSEEDLQSGFITAHNRRGMEEQYPLVSLSIAGISMWEGRFPNVFELSAESSRIKKECKMVPGSAYIIQ
jgi:diguanylate cyclase (GGDEF) domain